MELTAAVDYAGTTRQSVLTTIRKDGRPQLSNVAHLVGEDGVIRISITATRAKYANLMRQPWAALHVTAKDFWSYVVIEGDVTMTPLATSPDDPSVDELVELYRAMAGEHPDWDDYRRAMVDEQRTVVHLIPTRAYGMLQIPKASGT